MLVECDEGSWFVRGWLCMLKVRMTEVYSRCKLLDADSVLKVSGCLYDNVLMRLWVWWGG
jgi:hypothetical protein